MFFGVIVSQYVEAKRFFGNDFDDHQIGAGNDGFDGQFLARLFFAFFCFTDEKILFEEKEMPEGVAKESEAYNVIPLPFVTE